ncbi:AraC family transcriptional regulator [Methyloversatilis thermotolerans]|uniref:AraC family transcriptional regulator n=1 Tax=Methyloversatilis thermotolerans TaxID=1346290 RepID=UPI00037147B1|nr:AraC family transcriptional regulator [Methyloversatilis thermotolerans]
MPSPKHLREIRFENPRLSSVGVELLRLSDLLAGDSAPAHGAPERLALCLVLVISAGRGEHVVDFKRVGLAPGTVVVVAPGAVHQWLPSASLEGDVLLIQPQLIQPGRTSPTHALAHLLRLADWPACFTLTQRESDRWRMLCELLRSEQALPELDELSSATVRALQHSLLLVLARGAQQATPSSSEQELLCRQMARELDRLVCTRPAVATLARQLRTSPSTLNRCCHAWLGLSAKQVVDRRIALEAQRLLVHTDATAASVSEQLGFSEPTNFLKFFKRCVGVTPEQFRKAQRGGT